MMSLMSVLWLLMFVVTTSGVLVALVVACALLYRCRIRPLSLALHRPGAADDVRRSVIVGFFHPYAHAGGGGERVLWQGLRALFDAGGWSPESDGVERDGVDVRYVIYSGDVGVSMGDMLDRVEKRFGISFTSEETRALEVVYLQRRDLLEAARYPRFTMLGQSLGSARLAVEAIRKCRPHVFVDTTGLAFSYPVAWYYRCRVACYTHYPTITTDMLTRVAQRRPSYNNSADVSSSMLRTTVKLLYYRAFAAAYRWAGKFAQVVMVNSSWTQGHVASLWPRPQGGPPRVVYPPCNTRHLSAAPLGGRAPIILSVGQFRPEKDHRLQLAAFAKLKARGPRYDDVRLVLLGGARHEEDRQLVEELQQMAKRLGVQDSVTFRVNAPFSDLVELLGKSLIGLHTMWCEHFGIGVVELMAAGCVTIAHASGGPKSDIIVPLRGQRTGFLADTADKYARAMARIVRAAQRCPGALADDFAREGGAEGAASSSDDDSDSDSGGGDGGGEGGKLDVLRVVEAARESCARFSDESFSRGFVESLRPVIEHVLTHT